MSANSIDASFVEQFERDVHLAYQRFSALLPPTCRRKQNVKGKQTTFQTIGKGIAGKKGRNSMVPIMNLAHVPVPVILEDWYAGEYIDDLDELKIEHDERMAVARSISGALGRRSDQLIIDALDTASNATSGTGGIDLPKVNEIYIFFGNNDVPNDGLRFGQVSPEGWTDLMAIDQFSNADYIPSEELPFKGATVTMKMWFSFMWMQHSGLSKAVAERTSQCYHRTAIAHASQKDITLDITWQGKEQAHLFVGKMSQGAGLIDDLGVYRLLHAEA